MSKCCVRDGDMRRGEGGGLAECRKGGGVAIGKEGKVLGNRNFC